MSTKTATEKKKSSDKAKNIESIYPLSPMQAGLLFHTLMNPGTGVYLLQYRHVMEMERLDINAFKLAWQQVAERHDVLRTSFVWKKQKQALQVVHKKIELPIEILDWQQFDETEQQLKLDDILAEERKQGFDFTKAPLMSVRLIRLSENRYQFVRSYHHILMDAWCFSLIMMDFLSYYRANVKGERLSLPKPAPYKGFVAWLQKQDKEAALSFWREKLSGFDAPTAIVPSAKKDIEKNANETHVEDCVVLLSREDTEQGLHVARKNNLTLNTLVQAAWAILLSRYANEEDILFGVTVAGRPVSMPQMATVVGLFINSIPLRLRVPAGAKLNDWLHSLFSENINLREYEYAPLPDIQRCAVDMDAEQSLFDSLFVFENAPFDAGLNQENLEFLVSDATNRTHTNYPLTVVIIPGEQLHIQLTYHCSLLEHDYVAQMLAHFKNLVLNLFTALQTQPDIPLDCVDMLSKDEQESLRYQQNKPYLRTDADDYIHRFEARVEDMPNKMAVMEVSSQQSGGKHLSYRELNHLVNRLAHALREQGVKHDDRVALMAQRGIEFQVMILAVLKCGAAYLPLDPKHPVERLSDILELSACPYVLTQASLLEQVTLASSANQFVLEYDQALDTSHNTNNLNLVCHPRQLAYLIYTSGSTGKPKGVMVERAGMLNNILGKLAIPGQELAQGLDLSEKDIIAQTASQCFDISVWQFLAGVMVGGTVAILPDCIAHDPKALMTAIDKTGITVVELVPSLMRDMLNHAFSLASLRWMLPTGEALPPELARQWIKTYPQTPLMNAYGPAECSDDVAFYAIHKPLASNVVHTPIGTPTLNLQLYILDQSLHLVPPGAIGELYVAGVGVGRGYLNNAALSAEVFLPNPFGQEPGERLYKTGDLARRNEHGELEYLGRLDGQVKLRGFRIELGEIESRLNEHPDVQKSVVIVREDRPGDQRLVAYYDAPNKPEQAQTAIAADTLTDFLAKTLPFYMLPSAFVWLENLPLNANGKIHRRALPEPDYGMRDEANYIAPTTALEREIADIWQAVLNLDDVSILDNFFQHGGHSLLATQVIARMSAVFELELPLRCIFDCPTIETLAKYVESLQAEDDGHIVQTIPALDDRKALTLSFAQQRQWFLHKLDPDNSAYNISAALLLKGPLDLQALQLSLDALQYRHDILRTCYGLTSDGLVEQRIIADYSVPITHYDGSVIYENTSQTKTDDQRALYRVHDDSHEDIPDDIRQWLVAQASRPFNLAQDLMQRVQLVALNQEQHVLQWVIHHIAVDEWSIGIIVNELSTLYNTACHNTALNAQALAHTLTPQAIQYADFAAWQRQYLQGDVLEKQLAFWRQTLGDEQPILSLPTDYPRPSVQSYKGEGFAFNLDPDVCQRIQALHKGDNSVSPFVFLLGSFQLLLKHYAGQDDIRVGVPNANRSRLDTQSLVGFFVNTLVLRSQFTSGLSVNAFFQTLGQHSLAAQAHQEVPFELLVDELVAERELKHSPLFQVMFNFLQGDHRQQLALEAMTSSLLNLGHTRAPFELSLIVEAQKDLDRNIAYVCRLQFNTALFSRERIATMAKHYQFLLDQLLSALETEPERLLADVPVLTPADVHQQLVTWNNTQAPYPAERCIHEHFEAQALLTPNQVALMCGDQWLTYEQLNHQANQLAHYLRDEYEIKPDQLVGIYMPYSSGLMVSMLAILKAGAAYVPLDPDQPKARVRHIFNDANMRIVLSQSDTLIASPLGEGHLATEKQLCLDDTAFIERLTAYPTNNLSATELGLQKHHLAYVIYTSGSTGKPKGVMIERQGLRNLMHWYQKEHDFGDNDKCLIASAIGFDLTQKNMFAPLLSGATLILPHYRGYDPRQVLATIEREGITFINCAPSAIYQVVEAAAVNHYKGLSSLRTLFLGGEGVNAELLTDWLAHSACRTRVMNGYGPTECTQIVTATELDWRGTPALLGHAIPNVSTYVLDANLNVLPVGAVGELYVSGVGLARGYLNAPDQTEERFISNPFSHLSSNDDDHVGDSLKNTHERLYKTGDLVRWWPDGRLEYIGRSDFQIKLRGLRVELGEIEQALNQQPQVRESIVVVKTKAQTKTQTKTESGSDQYLVAYLVLEHSAPAGDTAQPIEALRKALADELPSYMLPSAYVTVESMPLNANGKLDRHALPEPDITLAQTQYVAPRNAMECELCGIWQTLLTIEQVGLHDDFFMLGGHSLLATRLVALINQHFKVDIPLRSVFEHTTLEGMAQLIQNDDKGQQVMAISHLSRDQPLHTSYAQTRLWLLDQIDGGSAQYNLPGALKLTGTLNVEALERAIQIVLTRHESLRTCFNDEDGQPVQVLKSEYKCALRKVDLSHLSADEQDIRTRELRQEEGSRAFDLSQDLMIRVTLLTLAEHSHVLLITLHHIAADGWSITLLIKEFSDYYQRIIDGKKPEPAPLLIQYADYAQWQRDFLQGEVLEQQLRYWQHNLSGLPMVHSLPLDYPRPQLQSIAGADHHSSIDATLTGALTTYCQHHQATLFMGLHAVFSTLLARYSNEQDIVIGTPIANREQAEVADLIGFFVNTLVLRSDLSGNPSFETLLKQSRESLLGAYAHQQLPFEQLLDVLQPERSRSHSPLFQVMLVLQNNENAALELPGLKLEQLEALNNYAKYDLTLDIREDASGLHLRWEYNSDLFRADSIAQLACHFERLLKGVISQPKEHVLAVNMLSEKERHQQLSEWNDTERLYAQASRAHSLHKCVEEQAQKQPHAVALCVNGRDYSYGELNAKSNQLAHYLRNQYELNADTLIGLCIERSADMLVAMLAILKAGGAYLPIDPSYPRARRRYILEHARPVLVLTQIPLLSLVNDTLTAHADDDVAMSIPRVCVDAPVWPGQSGDVKSAALPTSNIEIPEHSEQLAYTLYTSGSTGNPKGVQISRGAFMNFLHAMQEKLQLNTQDRCLAVTTISFDIAGLELFLPLMTGATVVLADANQAKDAEQLVELLRHQAISIMQATPATWQMILDCVDEQTPHEDKFWLGLQVLCGGEALVAQLANRLLAKGVALLNVYGPTETTVWSTCQDITSPQDRVAPIGKPIGNTQCYVLDRFLSPVPLGAVGELYIAGDGLASGYRDRQEVSADAFIPNPFSTTSPHGTRMYRTGDLARYRPDGVLDYVGRSDFQVKIRGFRIELGEIEQHLRQHPDIHDAVVTAFDTSENGSGQGNKVLVAYVVATETESDLDTQGLLAFLSRCIPDYMLPSAWVSLAALPLTPNGKIDRKALPTPDLSQQQESYVAPSSEIETALCTYWQIMLTITRVGVTDNFFQLGGHSLLAMKLKSHVHREYGVQLDLAVLFERPTIAAIAESIVTAQSLNQDDLDEMDALLSEFE